MLYLAVVQHLGFSSGTFLLFWNTNQSLLIVINNVDLQGRGGSRQQTLHNHTTTASAEILTVCVLTKGLQHKAVPETDVLKGFTYTYPV